MKELEERILNNSKIIDNEIIKVDSFLNHQIDVVLIKRFAEEVRKFFNNVKVDKILTVETSGIAVAYAIAEILNVPLVFAKKTTSKTTIDDYYKVRIKSFTRNKISNVIVSKKFLMKGMNVLIADDFLAEGNAALGLTKICKKAGAEVVGVAAVIEKIFQGGRYKLEDLGIRVFTGASIKAFEDNKPVF